MPMGVNLCLLVPGAGAAGQVNVISSSNLRLRSP